MTTNVFKSSTIYGVLRNSDNTTASPNILANALFDRDVDVTGKIITDRINSKTGRIDMSGNIIDISGNTIYLGHTGANVYIKDVLYGGGDVTLAGNNNFTGTNTFNDPTIITDVLKFSNSVAYDVSRCRIEPIDMGAASVMKITSRGLLYIDANTTDAVDNYLPYFQQRAFFYPNPTTTEPYTIESAGGLTLNATKLKLQSSGDIDLAAASATRFSTPTLTDNSLELATTAFVKGQSYLTSATAASTYQTIANMVNYLTTTTASSTYQTISGMSSYLTTATAASTYAALAGTNAFTGSNSFNSNLPTSTATPTTATQLITKAYGDATYSSSSGSVTLAGTNAFTGSNSFNSNLPTSTATPTTATQLVTKTYTDATFQLISGMASYLTTSAAASTYQTLSGMSSYLTTAIAASTYAALGGTNAFTGSNSFNSNLPTSTATPTTSTQLVTKSYTDATFQLASGMASYLTSATAASTYAALAGSNSFTNNNTFTNILSNSVGNVNIFDATAITAPKVTNGFAKGTGDGASYTTFNLAINSWWGIGFVDTTFQTCKMFIDVRNGFLTNKKVTTDALVVSGPTTFNTNLPTSTLTPTLSTELITKAYADATYPSAAGFISLAGNNVYTGTNAYNTSLPTSTLTPSTSTQLVTKNFTDTTYASKTGSNAFTSTNTFNSFLPTSTITPVNSNDLTTKTYTDSTYAPKASPTLTGTPLSTTASTADNSTQIATTAFVKNQGYAALSATQTFSGTNTFSNSINTNGGINATAAAGVSCLSITDGNSNYGSATSGSIFIRHGASQNDRHSSIVFASSSNFGSDFGFIRYTDNSTVPGEQGTLTIGIENDGDDNIQFAPTGIVKNFKVYSQDQLGGGFCMTTLADSIYNEYISRFVLKQNNGYIECVKWNSNRITNQGSIGISFFNSDQRLKENFQEPLITNICSYIEKIEFQSFQWKQRECCEHNGICELGVIAQQLESIYPNLINTMDDVDTFGDGIGTKAVNTNVFSTFMMKGIQELIAENKSLKSEIQKIKEYLNIV